MPRAKVWSVKGNEGGQVPFLVATGHARVAVALPEADCVRQEPGAGVQDAGCVVCVRV